MKRLITLVTTFVVLAATPAWASPFLVCDPDTTTNPPSYYRVVIDGAPAITDPAQAVTGGVRLHFDCAGMDFKVAHNFAVEACRVNSIGVEACSTPAVFNYLAPVPPSAPTGVRLEK